MWSFRVASSFARSPEEEEARIREDLSLSFQRGKTTFFMKGRYHEKDVIDLNNAGHLGLLAGQVRHEEKEEEGEGEEHRHSQQQQQQEEEREEAQQQQAHHMRVDEWFRRCTG